MFRSGNTPLLKSWNALRQWDSRTNRPLRLCVSAVQLTLLAVIALAPRFSSAASLEHRLDGLLGGMATSITPRGVGDPRPALPAGLAQLSGSLATFRSLAPVPSASGAFRFAWDPHVGTFNRLRKGPGLADTAQTLGRRFGTVGITYTRIDFDTLDGDSLSSLRSDQPAFSSSFLHSLPCEDPTDPQLCDRLRFDDDRLATTIDFALSLDQVVFGAAYGITDDIDVSLSLSLNHLRMRARANARLSDPNRDGPPSFESEFAQSHPCNPEDRLCASDGFDDSAFGTGDLYLRSKWRFATTRWADFAVSGTLTLPTGNADEFLGFHHATFTPLLIASKDFGRFSPHANVGYAFRDGDDVSQAIWIAGSDLRVVERVILAADFLGFHDDKRDGINDDVLQSAVGFKVNPFRSLVLSASFQFPLNRDGLRADVIYTGQVEWTF